MTFLAQISAVQGWHSSERPPPIRWQSLLVQPWWRLLGLGDLIKMPFEEKKKKKGLKGGGSFVV